MSLCLSKTTVRQIFLWMILIAGLSSLVTYHIGLLLPWVEINQPEIPHHVRINRVLMKEGSQLDLVNYRQQNQQSYRKQSEGSSQQISQVSLILAKLKQIEARLEKISSYRTVLASGLSLNQTQTLQNAMSEQNYSVVTVDNNPDPEGNWSVFWTSNLTDRRIQQFQKYNQIPVVEEVIHRPGYTCYLHTVYSQVIEGHNASCYDFLSVPKNKLSQNSKFVIFDEKNGVQKINGSDFKKHRSQGSVWYTDDRLLKQDGRYLHLKIPVFITSLFPLRLYIAVDKHVKKFQTKLSNQFGDNIRMKWWRNLKQSVVISLLTTEYLALNSQQDLKWCRCSQLLEFHVTLTSSLHPVILKVTSLTQSGSPDVLKDMVSLMVTKETVSKDLAVALGENSKAILLGRKECQRGYGICLLESDMGYLLDNAKESTSTGQFVKLYPSLAEDYTPIINRLQHLWMSERSLQNLKEQISKYDSSNWEFHTTPEVHSLLHQVESYISPNVDYKEEDLLRSNLLPNSNFNRHLKSSDQKDYVSLDDPQDNICSTGVKDAALLSQLEIHPVVDLELDPYQLTYDLTVNYDIIVLQLVAKSKGCLSEIRFDNISGSLSQSNYTLGLGDNVIRIHVVDTSTKQLVIVNTYTLNVYRQPRGQTGTPRVVLKNCILKQDCSLKFLPGEECGLKPSEEFTTWNQFVAQSIRLPYCKVYEDLLQAEWKVPCKSCNDSHSCYWKQARWQPSSCQHTSYNAAQIRQCFKGKKIMFIGDSTNRGIMHYMLEKINGSLSDWDKTHDLKLYTKVNDQQTTMSFAYYPQFWLPNNHRPGFDKAVYQLIKWTSPLVNNSNTVLVVGGVHWLGKQHINVILKALKREGLTGIKLVMKGHGAGFHQHVEGVHYADMAHQQKLCIQEREVGRYAMRHGFHVVPTFSMTMSRYKDFLQGKCACHFHKVTTGRNKHGQRKYHIEGEINAAYSELVINTICQHHPV